MGLSVAISGGIILTVFVLILLSLPGLADKMFSIGDITTQVSQHEKKISDTQLSMVYLSELVGRSTVNFTLNNDGAEKFWNFEDYDLFIEYDGAISGKRTEHLSYSGECLGTVPQAGNWCIQSISNDIADPKILNSGEQASIRTNLSQNLASTTAIVTLVTDNGVTFTTAGSSINTLESLTNVTDVGCALNETIKVNSTSFWVCAQTMNTSILAANLTNNNAAAYVAAFTIPLTANSGNIVEGILIASSNTATQAIQVRGRTDNAGTGGFCSFMTPNAAAASPIDNIAVGAAPGDTGEGTLLPPINIPIPIKVQCAVKTGVTPGSLFIEFQPEGGGATAQIRAGSYMIKSP
ncbi:MAG: hypothetical protein ACHQ1D_05915 [Nitrososphaerales archaeon]